MSFFSNLSNIFGKTDGEVAPSAHDTSQAKSKKSSGEPAKSKHKKTSSSKKRSSHPQQSQVRQAPVTRMPQADVQAAVREAQAKAREIIVEAKDEALAIRSQAEDKARKLNQMLEDQQRSIDKKLDRIDYRLSQLDKKETEIDKSRKEIETTRQDVHAKREQIIKKLEEISSLTTDQARHQLFENLEKKLAKEMAQYIKQKEEEARNEADEKVREIIVDAMKHGATDYVPEYTISTVELPSEEIKGKIIGKNGRNIHTFEKVTGVDLDLDSSPTEVRLSCFDSVRREIARVSLERLIKDGRIQPSRIEEVVAKVTTELEKIMFEAGKQLCHEVGVFNLPNDLMRMLGRFKYRFSYGQNLIAHTMEETKIGIKLAKELGANVNVVRLGCLLHDIGKVAKDEEGSHVELGVKIAKKYGLPQPVIDCIAQHHEDEPFTGPEQMIVYIADAISGARPGARYENYDEYVQRLEKLEEIAESYDGVKQAYAIQAGREVRVLLDPEQSKDDDVKILTLKIRDQIKDEMTYPGTVTVTVSRETRSNAVAA